MEKKKKEKRERWNFRQTFQIGVICLFCASGLGSRIRSRSRLVASKLSGSNQTLRNRNKRSFSPGFLLLSPELPSGSSDRAIHRGEEHAPAWCGPWENIRAHRRSYLLKHIRVGKSPTFDPSSRAISVTSTLPSVR